MCACGQRLAFLYAWARLSGIHTGSISLLAFIFGDYATQSLSLGPLSSAIYGALVILVITTLNWIGVHFGARAQNSLTIIEVLGLLLVIAAGLLLAPAAPSEIAATSERAFGLMMVFVLPPFGGWTEAVYVWAAFSTSRERNVG